MNIEPCSDPSGLVLARTRLVNRHGYVCPPCFVTAAEDPKYVSATIEELIEGFSWHRMPSAKKVLILDASQVPASLCYQFGLLMIDCRLRDHTDKTSSEAVAYMQEWVAR